MDHSFGTGEPFSVGVEEELLLVDPRTRDLAHVAERVLPGIEVPAGHADHEAFASELELRSPPRAKASEVARDLERAREAARGAGATLLGVGLHPAAEGGDVRLVDTDRYRKVESTMRGLILRTPECALHVHVGMPDGDTAVRAFNALRRHLALFAALGASSPFWFGRDSGLASARAAIVRSYPGRGVPPALRDIDDYRSKLDEVAAGGGPDDYTMLWWDVRLQPRLGTVELREIDAQSRLDDVAAIAALAQGLAAAAAEERPAGDEPSEHALAWSSFRAMRDGLDAEVADNGRLAPLVEVARAAAARARPYADADALEGVERLLREPSGPERQREAYATGGMPALLELLEAETAAPLAAQRPGAAEPPK